MNTAAARADSVFPRLEPLLAQVSKPIQYVGGELNSVSKDWDAVEVRWCLCYPDAYAIGQSNQGVAILDEVLNERDWILAERCWSPRHPLPGEYRWLRTQAPHPVPRSAVRQGHRFLLPRRQTGHHQGLAQPR